MSFLGSNSPAEGPLKLGGNYKVGAIADIIAKAAEATDERNTILRRVRHWTNLGLLVPNEEPHLGEGKHRHYDTSQIYVAVLLNALSEYQLNIGILKQAAYSFQSEIAKNPSIISTETLKQSERMFSLYEKKEGNRRFEVTTSEDPRNLSQVRSALYINISILYENLDV